MHELRYYKQIGIVTMKRKIKQLLLSITFPIWALPYLIWAQVEEIMDDWEEAEKIRKIM